MTRILITGGTGLLGPYLQDAAEGRDGRVRISGHRGGEVRCDLRDLRSIQDLITNEAPDTIINCAALTDVDGCEAEPDAAHALNATSVANIAEYLPHTSTLVQISTDQVYPDTPGPHAEESARPVNVYGASKLAGEAAALRHPESLVLRVNFFGPSRTEGRSSLSDWMARSFREHAPVTLFTDSLFSPLTMRSLAALVFELLDTGARGIFNAGSREGFSKHGFGLALAETLGLDASAASAGHATDIPGRARRPHDLRMNVDRLERLLGRPMPTLRSEIADLGRS